MYPTTKTLLDAASLKDMIYALKESLLQKIIKPRRNLHVFNGQANEISLITGELRLEIFGLLLFKAGIRIFPFLRFTSPKMTDFSSSLMATISISF